MFRKQEDNVQFPAAKTMLSVIRKEYEYELQRKSAIETRTGIFITLLIAFFTFAISNLDFSKLLFFQVLTNVKLVQVIISTLLIIIGISSWTASITYFIKVLVIYKYDRINLKDFNQEFARYKEDVICISIAEAYEKVVERNQKINDIKAKHYIKGIYFLIPFITCIMVLLILSIML